MPVVIVASWVVEQKSRWRMTKMKSTAADSNDGIRVTRFVHVADEKSVPIQCRDIQITRVAILHVAAELHAAQFDKGIPYPHIG
jgi:hypothetical protein